MKGKIFFMLSLCIFLTGILYGCVEEEKKIGFSRSNPAPVGTPVTTTFDISNLYFDDTNVKTKAEITVMQVLRGTQARNKLETELSDYLYPTDSGYELLLILIQFKYLECEKNTGITPGSYFWAYSGEGKILTTWAFGFEPNLKTEIYPGGQLTGWILYTVSVNDEQPFLVFDEEAFFKLYHD